MENQINIGDYVLYKNNQLIAVNKPPGIGVQSDKTGDVSLQNLVEIYCKHQVHLIHRIDRPASGVVLFAKNKRGLAALNEQFRDGSVSKQYWTVVKNAPEKPDGELTHLLMKKGTTNRTKVVDAKAKNGREAKLKYTTLASSDIYHLLEIDLLTGRHHQIRAQLSAIGSPIKGDVKYGFKRGNKDRSIHLHAHSLTFKHPVSGEKTEVIAPLPAGDPLWKFFEEKMKN